MRADDSVTVLRRSFVKGADERLSIQNSEKVYFGRIESLGKDEIVLVSGADRLRFSVDSVMAVVFDQEPVELITALLLFRTSQYGEAVSRLTEISALERARLKDQVRDEIDALDVRAAAEESLLENSSLSKKEKIKRAERLALFIGTHPDNWHYYEICFLAGSVFWSVEDSAQALVWFDRAGQAPWQEMKLNALLQKGRILLQLQKSKEAKEILAPILKIDIDKSGQDPIINTLLVHAQMAYFDALADQKNFGESIEGYRRLTQYTGQVKEKVCAEIYNGLGRVLTRAGKWSEATHAFLHVDLLYSSAWEEHEKALRELSALWRKLGRADRAQETDKILRERYGIEIDVKKTQEK